MKILFIPVSVTGGLVSGFLAKKLFEQVWGVIDDTEPPKPEHRRPGMAKVVAAAALEGAIFKGTRAAIDHKSREAFASATGVWPGDEEPEKE
ncbi:MAG: hypothetical protein QOF55_1451 [Thermoleophilaceae bacterium]|jgi:hypothetical protein|nr:hypothetical protein [Thermoleophilaceae bacterium]